MGVDCEVWAWVWIRRTVVGLEIACAMANFSLFGDGNRRVTVAGDLYVLSEGQQEGAVWRWIIPLNRG